MNEIMLNLVDHVVCAGGPTHYARCIGEYIPYIAYPILVVTHLLVAIASVTRYALWFDASRTRRRDKLLFASKNIYLAAGFMSLILARAFADSGRSDLDHILLYAARASFLLAALAMLTIVVRGIIYGRNLANDKVL